MLLHRLHLVVQPGILYYSLVLTVHWEISYRGSILTGKYVHNHQIYQDHATTGCYSLSWRENDEQRTIGVHLAKAGYKTGFFGVLSRLYIIIIVVVIFRCVSQPVRYT